MLPQRPHGPGSPLRRGYFSSTSWPSDWTNGALGILVSNHGSHEVVSKSTLGGLIPLRGHETPGACALPATNQNCCYADFDNEIGCTGTGQDGEFQIGIAWPSPRFTTNIDSTITDLLTGLIWTQNAGAEPGNLCLGIADPLLNWQEALDYVACLNSKNFLGYDDWRLPNVVELRSLLDISKENPSLPPGHPFLNVNTDSPVGYWTSSTLFSNYHRDEAWSAFIGFVYVGPASKTYEKAVWPVRGEGSMDKEKGAINGDGTINLEDAIIAIQIVTGKMSGTIYLETDVDEDGYIGIVEAITVLQKLSGLSGD